MYKTLLQAIILLACTAGAAILTAFIHPNAPDLQPPQERSPLAISLAETASEERSLLWIDARPLDEYEADHIPGAIWVSEDDWDTGFENFAINWTPEMLAVVYCDAEKCHASEAVAMRLRRESGGEEIYFLEGGWGVWLENVSQ